MVLKYKLTLTLTLRANLTIIGNKHFNKICRITKPKFEIFQMHISIILEVHLDLLVLIFSHLCDKENIGGLWTELDIQDIVKIWGCLDICSLLNEGRWQGGLQSDKY